MKSTAGVYPGAAQEGVATRLLSSAVILLVRDPDGALRLLPQWLPGRTFTTVRREELRRLGPWGVARHLRTLGADEVVILTDDLNAHEAIWRLQALGALPLARRREIRDLHGRRLRLTAALFLARDLPYLAAGLIAGGIALARTARRMRTLERAPRRVPRAADERCVCYFRSDLWSGIPAGGSVGHTLGVASGLSRHGCDVDFVASYRPVGIETIAKSIVLVPPRRLYTASRGLPALAHSLLFEAAATGSLTGRRNGILYQRFDPASHAGVMVSRRLGLPFVLEYNGSEVWIADNWGRPLPQRSLFERIESANLRHADLISVVSAPLRDELMTRGVEPERIVVLPNGVDTERYRPDLDGRAVRARHGLQGQTVVGFIGTFEAWHGAQVLARAAARLLELRPQTRFLFVGDGPQRRATEQILADSGHREQAVFTGLVPQQEGPEHLAAMDIVIAPHVPNADGTRFFGSPTKLFEYMAMGRAIVASRLEQLGEILEDGRTALLIPPNDEASLAQAMRRLCDDAGLRVRLGDAARRRAMERHTWTAHAFALIERLRAMGLVTWS